MDDVQFMRRRGHLEADAKLEKPPRLNDIWRRNEEQSAKATAYVDSLVAKQQQAFAAAPQDKAQALKDAAAVETLARMVPLDYDRIREEEAARLGVRVSTLDDEVKRRRSDLGLGATHDNNPKGSAVALVEHKPWPEPVDGSQVLSEVAEWLKSYVLLPDHADKTIALWIAHTHCFSKFEHSPRLNITAPEKQCGKSLLLDVLEPLTQRAIHADSVSTAVTFRLIDQYAPTLLVDEYDSFLVDNEDLRGALNAGHKRGGQHLRCEGENNDVRAFKTFGPVALAGIGSLPGTLADRSIIVKMKRAKRGEIPERFDSRRVKHLHELAQKLARWALDNQHQLERADPTMPEGFYNRVADNWRPLLAIADAVGGNWVEWARKAAEELSGDDGESSGLRVQLLEDIQQILTTKPVGRISSEELTKALLDIEESPWPEAHRGKAITKSWLSRQLRKFEVISGTVKFLDGTTAKGYSREQFIDAFARYLPTETSPRHLPTATRPLGDSENVTSKDELRFEKPAKANIGGAGDGVTFLNLHLGESEDELRL